MLLKDNYTVYPTSANTLVEQPENLLTAFLSVKNGTVNSFDNLKSFLHNYHILQRVEGNFSCWCRQFQKKYMCKHSLGMSIYHGIVEIPSDMLSTRIGVKRKRGRPAKAKPALVRQ
jgi:hypothetical protein